MRAADTTAGAEALQLQIQRRLGGPARLRLALEMSVAARTMALARPRLRYPNHSQRELQKALLRETFPPERLPPPLR